MDASVPRSEVRSEAAEFDYPTGSVPYVPEDWDNCVQV